LQFLLFRIEFNINSKYRNSYNTRVLISSGDRDYSNKLIIRILSNGGNLSYYLIRPCKSTAAFEAIPQKIHTLNLHKIEQVLKNKGYTIEANAEVVLVVSKHGYEISVFKKGKLMIKVDELETAETIAAEMEKILF